MGLLKPHGRGRRPFRRDALNPPAIVVHSLALAVASLTAAAEAGRAVVLLSAPECGLAAGPAWFREMIAAARVAVPAAESEALLDCGDDAGAAQAAIRAGVEAIVFAGPAETAARLADIAGQAGLRVLTERPRAVLDLGDRFFDPPEALHKRIGAYLSAGADCR